MRRSRCLSFPASPAKRRRRNDHAYDVDEIYSLLAHYGCDNATAERAMWRSFGAVSVEDLSPADRTTLGRILEISIRFAVDMDVEIPEWRLLGRAPPDIDI